MSGSPDVAVGLSDTDSAAARTRSRLGWLLWFAAILPAAAGLALLAGSIDAPIPSSYGFRGFPALFALSYGSVGALVVTRRPGNRVGAILIAIGIAAGILVFLIEYANVGLVAAPGSLPGALWAAWLGSFIWVPIVILAGPLLLSLYPDGRFVSPAWRRVALFGVALGPVTMLGIALEPGPMNNFRFVNNPIGILPLSISETFATIVSFPLVVVLIACAGSLVVRFRAAGRESRQQLKWFALAGLVLAATGPLGFIGGQLGSVVFVVALCALPAATGMAVLRYGLYEIDTVINRALVYGLLTAILAGLYTASIGVMQRVSKAFTGVDSDAAIILTTIVVVTAFTPVKGKLQSFVDRRFKENRDPAVRLTAFVRTVQDAMSPLDPQKTFRRLLTTAAEACDSPGGRIALTRSGEETWSAVVGEEPLDGTAATMTAALGNGRVSLSLCPPARSGVLSKRDRAAVEGALLAVVAELAAEHD